MEFQYREDCVECMDIWGSRCHGHAVEAPLKPYPPTDLQEGTRPLQAGEYCASCGYQHGGYPGASCGKS